MVGMGYQVGDRLAKEILVETVELLTVWLGNTVGLLDLDLLNPEVIIGGGIALMLSPFFQDLQASLPKWRINAGVRDIPLRMARYGADAGIAGGAALCSEFLDAAQNLR
jgi:predicted NBD/HSP70 family sugar kinase